MTYLMLWWKVAKIVPQGPQLEVPVLYKTTISLNSLHACYVPCRPAQLGVSFPGPHTTAYHLRGTESWAGTWNKDMTHPYSSILTRNISNSVPLSTKPSNKHLIVLFNEI